MTYWKHWTLVIIVIMVTMTAIFIAVRRYTPEYKETEPIVEYECITPTKQVFNMSAVCYNPVKGQTDNDPYTTASGMKINKRDAKVSRFIALPQWMLKSYNPNAPFKYGDTLWIESKDKNYPYWGAYIAADCTPRASKMGVIDICVGVKDTMNRFFDIKLSKYNK